MLNHIRHGATFVDVYCTNLANKFLFLCRLFLLLLLFRYCNSKKRSERSCVFSVEANLSLNFTQAEDHIKNLDHDNDNDADDGDNDDDIADIDDDAILYVCVYVCRYMTTNDLPKIIAIVLPDFLSATSNH